MPTRNERIVTTHVGSLIRPAILVDFMRAMDKGVAIDTRTYGQCLHQEIESVVKRQNEVGIDIVSDGEFGKLHLWAWYVMDRLSGIEFELAPPEMKAIDLMAVTGKDASLFPEFYEGYFKAQGFDFMGIPVCVGPIQYVGQKALKRDIANLKAAMKAAGVKQGFLPVVAPASAAPIYIDRHYQDEETFLFALADAMHHEYAAIVEAGLSVQIDDAFLPYAWDMIFQGRNLKKYLGWCELRIEALNHALKGIPIDKVRYHICWGSFNSPHVSDIPFEKIAALVLRVEAGGYAIEMANPRHEHEWQVWKKVALPEGRQLLPGVISHATNIVEHPDLVAERIVRLANLVGRDNVVASTDCGFAQGPYVQRVHPSIQWAKLDSLVQGARRASSQLWGCSH